MTDPGSGAGAPGATPPTAPPPDEGLPPPPSGPGVRVPFGAPPRDRDNRRLWIRLGVGAGLLGVCCVAGVLGTGTVLVQSGNDLRRAATTTVDQYLADLHESNYASAYSRYCNALRKQTSFADFEATEERQTPVSSYRLEEPRPSGSTIWVRAEVVRENGQQQTPDFKLVQEGETATSLKICQVTQ